MRISNSDKKSRKILVMGLDNGGKTSLVLSLQRNTNLLSYYSLKPTIGKNIVNFEDHETAFNIWDFGGQEQYRQDYFQHLDEYLKATDRIIFVIDIQDIERYELALDYLKRLIEAIKNDGIDLDFSIFLHKFDPDLEEMPNFADKAIAVNLLDKIKKIMPPQIHYKLFKTSIFTVFQKRPIYY